MPRNRFPLNSSCYSFGKESAILWMAGLYRGARCFANKFYQTDRNNRAGIKFHKGGTQAKRVNLISSLMFRGDCVEVYQRDALKSALTFSFQQEWKHFILPAAFLPLLPCSMLHFSSDINFNLGSFSPLRISNGFACCWILTGSCVWENGRVFFANWTNLGTCAMTRSEPNACPRCLLAAGIKGNENQIVRSLIRRFR